MKTLIVIPARYASSRLPGKPLLDKTGFPLIQHVHTQAARSQLASDIVVATDDKRIESVVRGFGGNCVFTSPNHVSGSDRIAEVVGQLTTQYDVIINVQGDEPEVEPDAIDQLARLQFQTSPFMSTLASRFSGEQVTEYNALHDPGCVKVVLGKNLDVPEMSAFKAVYFSRSLIPYPRQNEGEPVCISDYNLHIGMYAYSQQSIIKFSQLQKSRLESIEQLEQLRAIENDLNIHVALVDGAVPGIDTPDDYAAFVTRWGTRSL